MDGVVNYMEKMFEYKQVTATEVEDIAGKVVEVVSNVLQVNNANENTDKGCTKSMQMRTQTGGVQRVCK